MSGGLTTDIRRNWYGEIPSHDHDFLWSMGQLAGVSVSFMLGFQLPGAFQASAGWARWTALGWAGFTEGYGVAGAVAGLTDGQWECGFV